MYLLQRNVSTHTTRTFGCHLTWDQARGRGSGNNPTQTQEFCRLQHCLFCSVLIFQLLLGFSGNLRLPITLSPMQSLSNSWKRSLRQETEPCSLWLTPPGSWALLPIDPHGPGSGVSHHRKGEQIWTAGTSVATTGWTWGTLRKKHYVSTALTDHNGTFSEDNTETVVMNIWKDVRAPS